MAAKSAADRQREIEIAQLRGDVAQLREALNDMIESHNRNVRHLQSVSAAFRIYLHNYWPRVVLAWRPAPFPGYEGREVALIETFDRMPVLRSDEDKMPQVVEGDVT